MRFKPTAFAVLISLTSVALGYSLSSYLKPTNRIDDVAPKVFVARCGFQFSGKDCGEITRKVLFLWSDELLSYTDNWAVGRIGRYKAYLSCFDTGDEKYIDGSFSSLTTVVSGPELSEAYRIAGELMTEFSDYISQSGDSMDHCIES